MGLLIMVLLHELLLLLILFIWWLSNWHDLTVVIAATCFVHVQRTFYLALRSLETFCVAEGVITTCSPVFALQQRVPFEPLPRFRDGGLREPEKEVAARAGVETHVAAVAYADVAIVDVDVAETHVAAVVDADVAVVDVDVAVVAFAVAAAVMAAAAANPLKTALTFGIQPN